MGVLISGFKREVNKYKLMRGYVEKNFKGTNTLAYFAGATVWNLQRHSAKCFLGKNTLAYLARAIEGNLQSHCEKTFSKDKHSSLFCRSNHVKLTKSKKTVLIMFSTDIHSSLFMR